MEKAVLLPHFRKRPSNFHILYIWVQWGDFMDVRLQLPGSAVFAMCLPDVSYHLPVFRAMPIIGWEFP